MSSESSIERRCAAYAQKHGGVLVKMYGQGWPDRQCLLPNGKHFFVEFKRDGGELSPSQKHMQQVLRAMGYECFEIDNRHLFERLVNERLHA